MSAKQSLDSAVVAVKQRKYQPIWEAIKTASIQRPVQVACHPDYARTLIQAVKKEKTIDVAIRKRLALPRQGTLKISKEPETINNRLTGRIVVSFILKWDGTQL